MHPRLATWRRGFHLGVSLGVLVALGAGGCGRRGAPEPPSSVSSAPAPARSTSAATARNGAGPQDDSAGASPTSLATNPQTLTLNTPDDETDSEDTLARVSPQPTPGPTSRRRQPFVAPKQPFILDPLL